MTFCAQAANEQHPLFAHQFAQLNAFRIPPAILCKAPCARYEPTQPRASLASVKNKSIVSKAPPQAPHIVLPVVSPLATMQATQRAHSACHRKLLICHQQHKLSWSKPRTPDTKSHVARREAGVQPTGCTCSCIYPSYRECIVCARAYDHLAGSRSLLNGNYELVAPCRDPPTPKGPQRRHKVTQQQPLFVCQCLKAKSQCLVCPVVSTCCRSSPAAPPAPALPRLAPPSVSRVAAHALQASSKYVTQKSVHTACSPPAMQPLARQALLSAQSTPHFAYQATKRANPTKKPYPGRKAPLCGAEKELPSSVCVA